MNIQSQNILSNLSIVYSLVSISFLINWFRFKHRRPSLYPEDKFISFIIIVIIAVFWFLALTLYLAKFVRKNKI